MKSTSTMVGASACGAPVARVLLQCSSRMFHGRSMVTLPRHKDIVTSKSGTMPLKKRNHGKRRSGVVLASSQSDNDFVETDYFKVGLHMVQQGSGSSPEGGYLLFLLDNEPASSKPESGLVLAVGGDTFQAILMLLQGTRSRRPLTVDLLWEVLQRGQEISKRDWRLLRMAITDMKDSTFIGRLYFGDSCTGEVAWSVDCRPSDGTWLALRSKAPIYVAKPVWQANTTQLRDVDKLQQQEQQQLTLEQTLQNVSNALDQMNARNAPPTVPFNSKVLEIADPDNPLPLMTSVFDTDPEPIKLLKMELKVALKDEDYETAARIREHHYLKLYIASVMTRKNGNGPLADTFEEALQLAIDKDEEKAREDAADRGEL